MVKAASLVYRVSIVNQQPDYRHMWVDAGAWE